MPTIQANTGVITQINVFTVEPAQQDALIEHLIGAAAVASSVPGWKSISIHKGIDGRSVVNYAQTESLEAQSAVFQELTSQGIIEKGHAFGVPRPGLYQTVYTLER